MLAPATDAPADRPANGPAKRILLVDDDGIVREFARTVLEGAGFQVLEAASGTEAVQLARERQPHLVLSDVVMENGDGYAALRQLRLDPATALIPIVLMTANADLRGMRHGMSLGADDYLPKPVSAQSLLAAVETQFRKHALLRRQAERELEELRSNLNLALPHELNTPLNGILGAAQLLKDDAPNVTPDVVAELADCILVSGNRLHRVARNFLAYAEIEMTAGDSARLAQWRAERLADPGAAVEEIAHATAGDHHRQRDLQLELAPITGARIGGHWWRKIVEELVRNAFTFSGAGTPVRIAVRRTEGHASLVVVDRGRGMTPDQVARIGAYAQFDRKVHAHEGLGLGLAIARRLAELHAGSLDLESRPGQGTTVTVRLPA
jgi:signal transduction histidine kinase